MVRNNAVEILQALAGISVPFFRMPLMRRDLSEQHQLLIKLEMRFPNAVYYASPSMQDIHAFNAAYNIAQVHQRSVLFSPRNIGRLHDDKPHSVAYRHGMRHAWLCSEPRRISLLRFDEVEQKAASPFNDQRFRRLQDAADNIREEMLPLVSPEIRSSVPAIRERVVERTMSETSSEIDEQKRQIAQELLVSREIARVGLGLEMTIVQPAN